MMDDIEILELICNNLIIKKFPLIYKIEVIKFTDHHIDSIGVSYRIYDIKLVTTIPLHFITIELIKEEFLFYKKLINANQLCFCQAESELILFYRFKNIFSKIIRLFRKKQ